LKRGAHVSQIIFAFTRLHCLSLGYLRRYWSKVVEHLYDQIVVVVLHTCAGGRLLARCFPVEPERVVPPVGIQAVLEGIEIRRRDN
jgi:hypothetical protein